MTTHWQDNFNLLGSIFILCGPSGAGKSTIIKKILNHNPNISFSVSCTTRKPRIDEKNKVDYFFISKKSFLEKIKNNEFLEYAKVHNEFYGTLKSEVLNKVETGKSLIIEIDIQGVKQIKKYCTIDKKIANSSTFIFVAPPSYKILKKRLLTRGSDDSNIINNRLETAKEELKYWRDFDYLIVNIDKQNSINAMQEIINLSKIKVSQLNPKNKWPYE